MPPRQLRPARREDLAQLVELWEVAFGDEVDFIHRFFRLYCPLEQVLVAVEGAAVRAMLSLLPLSWREGGAEGRLAYVYALATHPAGRGQGHAHALLDYAAQVAREGGFDGLCTVPARPELHPFFASAGYREGLRTRRRLYTRRELERVPAEALPPVQPCSGAEYGTIRERRLAAVPHGGYPVELLEFQAEQGELFRLCLPEGPGCAAVERQGDTLVIKELLAPEEETLSVLRALMERCDAEHCQVRTPAGPGEDWAFGMGRWLDKDAAPAGYLGLGFD